MVLKPCGSCRRHFVTSEPACPFCGAATVSQSPRPVRAGRLARAALFASTALAGCDQGKPPDQPVAKEPIKAPRIHGIVTDGAKAPVVGANVMLAQPTAMPDAVRRNYTAFTDERGRYVFEQIEPGTYQLAVSYSQYELGRQGQKRGFESKQVTVAPDSDQQVDVTLVINIIPTAMPYGAPPARRRVV